MSISIGADHYGFQLKEALSRYLTDRGHEVLDCGPASDVPDSLLIDRADGVVSDVLTQRADRGLLLCMSGGMMLIRANRYPGIRATFAYTPDLVAHDREASDSNLLVFAGNTPLPLARDMLVRFLDTPFVPLERRLQRLARLDTIPS